MTSTPDRRRGWRWAGPAALALALCGAGPGQAVSGQAVSGQAVSDAANGLMRDARAALARGDGIGAEVVLREAMAAGLPREAISARMGEALLDQGDRRGARLWLAPARFTMAERAHGWRMLGRLELAERNFGAADAAFAQALRIAPDDSRLWVDIARLRYVAGQELLAIPMADRAVRLDPGNVRALELRGLLLRDQYGLEAALPWLESAIKRKPDDLALLGEYAATLGEMGRAREMLVITRAMIGKAAKNPRPWFLQAVLAARSGDFALARQMLGRGGSAILKMPSGLMLSGALELQAGNTNLAVERLDLLARAQPRNTVARDLLARALAATGNPALVIERFGDEAKGPGASPYLLTLVARAFEDSGRRDLAAPLLDRAARAGPMPVAAMVEPSALGVLALRYGDAPQDAGSALPYVRKLLDGGDLASAGAVAERIVAGAPDSAAAQALAGDVRLLRGDLTGAIEGYRRAASVRLPGNLMIRLSEVYGRAGQGASARAMVSGVLRNSPRERTALRLAAGYAAEDGNWPLAAAILDWLARTGDRRDARLLADLAIASQQAGLEKDAIQAAASAYRLQRASPTATRAMAEMQGAGTRGRAAFMAKVASVERPG